MSSETPLLQGLITSLDDARVCHCSTARKTTQAHLRHSLERVIQTHMIIAADLADHIDGRAKRSGSHLAIWRMRHAGWLARISPDIEAAYAIHAEKYETRVLRHFRNACASTRDVGMRDRLKHYGCEIEHACTDISRHSLMMRMQGTPLAVRTSRK